MKKEKLYVQLFITIYELKKCSVRTVGGLRI